MNWVKLKETRTSCNVKRCTQDNLGKGLSWLGQSALKYNPARDKVCVSKIEGYAVISLKDCNKKLLDIRILVHTQEQAWLVRNKKRYQLMIFTIQESHEYFLNKLQEIPDCLQTFKEHAILWEVHDQIFTWVDIWQRNTWSNPVTYFVEPKHLENKLEG